jgi:hypothetical protein
LVAFGVVRGCAGASRREQIQQTERTAALLAAQRAEHHQIADSEWQRSGAARDL